MTALRLAWPEPTPAPVEAPQSLEAPARHFFDAVLDTIAPGATALGRMPRPGEVTVARLEEVWADAQVLSFDVFDTLIVRKVATPVDVFLHLGQLPPFATTGLSVEALAQARQRAEQVARRRAFDARGSAEVSLAAIHAVLAEAIGVDVEAVPEMVRAEQLVERALCVAHPTCAAWFARARAEGKRCWVVSDTYHDAAFLTVLLEGCGYDLTGVAVHSSADEGVSKGDGRLFTRLLERSGVAPGAVVHVGDHPVGDERVPESQGIVAVRHPWPAARLDDAPAAAPGDSVALGLSMIGARTVEPPFPFWWRFGYATAGPVLAGFALWLRHRFARDGIERAYFLLRDGEIIEQAYALLAGTGGPATALLESSRRAYTLPALESGKGSLLTQLVASENPRPVREFLTRMGLRPQVYEGDIRAAGFASGDEIASPWAMEDVARVATLMGRPAVARALVDRSREERRLLMAFLREAGVLAPGRVALVDIGWNATIQKALTTALDLERHPYSMHGYYLGALAQAKQEMSAGSTVSGYLFAGGEPAHRVQPVLQLRQLVEFICTTTRGSLKGFRWDDEGRSVPVHGAPDHDPAQAAAHAQLREGALAYVAALAQERVMFGFDQVGPDAALRRLARVIQHPSAEEAEMIGDLTHGEGLGSERVRRFAAFTPGAWDAASLRRDLATAYWPAGLLARRAPQALVLRTLGWLESR